MTRVLHVTECYSAGVGRAIDAAVRVAPQHDHHLLWSGDEAPTGEVPFSSITELPTGFIRRIAATRRRALGLNPDVIFAHSSWAGVYVRAIRNAKPVVYEPHCYKFEDLEESALKRKFYWLIEKILSRRSDVTVVLSPREERLARQLHASGVRHFVPNVASSMPTETARATGYASGTAVVMSGRIFGQKDPDHFARVAELVHKKRPDLEFRWIGDGDPHARRILESRGVSVTGWLGDQALAVELARPFVYYHSARYEGFPLSVLDASAFEHPIVVRQIPAFEGVQLPQADTADAAAAVLLDIFAGGENLKLAVDGSRALLESMSPERQREALETLYRSF